MKSRLRCCALAALAIGGGTAWGQEDPVNTELAGQWDGYGGLYGDVWGDGDYAYVAHYLHRGVHIVDISDPTQPTPVTEILLPGDNGSASAQDVKVADGLLFIGIESGSDSVFIVDVRDPTNPLPVATIAIAGYRSIHNTFYDNGYLYIADSNTNRVGIIDLTTLDPDNPPPGPITSTKWIVQRVGSSFVHDVTVVDGRLYACAWDSGLWIYDVTNVAAESPSFLGNTPDGGDNTHSCWPSSNGDYVVTGEERSGGGIKVYSITDNGGSLTLQLTDTFALPTFLASTVHNQVFSGYRLYNSWYGGGLQVFDVDPGTGLLEFVASYDTTASGSGAWGVYPLLGPDRVLVSDINNGLFVISVDGVLGDLDGDGSVGVTDLLILLGAWGPCPDPCPPSCPADLDGDCSVGVTDLLSLLGNWG